MKLKKTTVFLMIKRVSMILFETFVQKQNDNLFFLETQKEG